MYAKTVKAELDLALSQKKEVVETTTGGKYESEVQKLYEGLDAINIDVRTSLISAYSTLVLRISSSKEPSVQAEAFKKWDETLELVIKESFKIRTINSQLALQERVRPVANGKNCLLWDAKLSRMLSTLNHKLRLNSDH